jgi:7-cyano-7-deazaguanine synthase
MPDAPAPADAAVVLLSGGLDSATCLAIAQHEGYRCHALTFSYGQRHAVEVEAARRVAGAAGVELTVAQLDLRAIGGSALTDDIAVPKDAGTGAAGPSGGPLPGGDDDTIPVTYVPARNTIFLAYALAVAEVRGARAIFIGVNALDYSGYPDCRPEFVEAFERLANLATRAGVDPAHPGRIRIRTPLISLTKADIVRRGVSLGVDHSLTTSCYDPVPAGPDGWAACGRCDSCRLRRRGFRDAGRADPIAYADDPVPDPARADR